MFFKKKEKQYTWNFVNPRGIMPFRFFTGPTNHRLLRFSETALHPTVHFLSQRVWIGFDRWIRFARRPFLHFYTPSFLVL